MYFKNLHFIFKNTPFSKLIQIITYNFSNYCMRCAITIPSDRKLNWTLRKEVDLYTHPLVALLADFNLAIAGVATEAERDQMWDKYV